MQGHYAQAKKPFQWVMSNSKKYKQLHYAAGRSLVCVYKRLSQYQTAQLIIDYLMDHFSDEITFKPLFHLEHALIKYHLGDFMEGDDEVEQARERLDETKLNSSHEQYYLLLQARCLEISGRLNDAIECYENTRIMCEDSKSIFALIQAETNIGFCLMEIGEDRLAEKFLNTALLRAYNGNHQYWIAQGCLGLLQLAFKKDDILAAKEYGRHCFRLSISNSYRDMYEEACVITGDHYASNGNAEVADAFYRKAVNVGSESPIQVLEKVDRIYCTSYRKKTLNLKITTSNQERLLVRTAKLSRNSTADSQLLKHRFIFGSVKTKSPDHNCHENDHSETD